ncbi:MAG: lysophospholipid acyltransferase family protein [Candidatus Omnitrophica bacterium]|nr:lysophospholipid acyltransferase family protein [Candidatus Omnitrophota bacterium]
MKAKELLKNFQRGLARNGLKANCYLMDRLPYVIFYVIAHIFMAIAYIFIVRHKRIAKESLDIAFGGTKTEKEKRFIIKKCFYEFGYGMFEVLYCLSNPGRIDEKITIEGEEKLISALDKGKGVIAVTAHFGNFPLMMLYFAHKKYPVSCIIRPTRDEELTRLLHEKREKAGLKTIYAAPKTECVAATIKALRNQEVVFIPIDQNFGAQGGVYVEFFGQKAGTATGPIVFARRTDAVILPMFIVGEGKDRHRIIIEDPVLIEEKEDEKATLTYNMAFITKTAERYIRKYPYEWAWMHRRWKSQPLKSQREED